MISLTTFDVKHDIRFEFVGVTFWHSTGAKVWRLFYQPLGIGSKSQCFCGSFFSIVTISLADTNWNSGRLSARGSISGTVAAQIPFTLGMKCMALSSHDDSSVATVYGVIFQRRQFGSDGWWQLQQCICLMRPQCANVVFALCDGVSPVRLDTRLEDGPLMCKLLARNRDWLGCLWPSIN